MSIIWWSVLGMAVSGIAWHEVVDHHVIGRMLGRPAVQSEHDQLWLGLPGSQRRAIHVEMLLLAGAASACTALWGKQALIAAGLVTFAAWVSVAMRHPAGS